MIKAIFFDIDGTLVSFNSHKIPDSTLKALDIFRENNIKLFISTGRRFESINNLGDYPFDGYVTVNGAITWLNGKIIDRHPILREDSDRFLCYCHDNKIPVAVVLENALYLNIENEDTEEIFRLINFPKVQTRNIKELLGQQIFQFITFFKEDQEEQILKVIPNCISQRWHTKFTDIVGSGISKVKGIEAVMNHFGFSREEIASFGDGGNDLEMLKFTYKSVAMGNAIDKVKNVAGFVTSHIDQDGVFNSIDYILG